MPVLQMYNQAHSMDTSTFWRYSVGTATLGGAIVFFMPYFAITVRKADFLINYYEIFIIKY